MLNDILYHMSGVCIGVYTVSELSLLGGFFPSHTDIWHKSGQTKEKEKSLKKTYHFQDKFKI